MVVMRKDAGPDEVERVLEAVGEAGIVAPPCGEGQGVVVVVADRAGGPDPRALEGMPGVVEVLSSPSAFPLASRQGRTAGTVVELANGTRIGGAEVVVMAGPCSVESEEQILQVAHFLRGLGVRVLRGGAFKPRTSPYSFQGLGRKGLELLARAREVTGLAVVTEAVDVDTLQEVAQVADLIQVGARNMQNYSLLRRVGRLGKPVLLKRGFGATVEELLLAAEYILAEGNPQVVLCERGVRGFDPRARHFLDLAAVPYLKALSHLPVVVDPSHGTGDREFVLPMARAAVAAGADGLLVEVHPNPPAALSDGAQSLFPHQFAELWRQGEAVARAVGRGWGG